VGFVILVLLELLYLQTLYCHFLLYVTLQNLFLLLLIKNVGMLFKILITFEILFKYFLKFLIQLFLFYLFPKTFEK